MLELKRVTKEYPAGGQPVEALKGIDLQFRESEFVSILGPSGCGKTTLLNLIGGLDQYTSGDLIINGRSTKDFKDRDWDAYRNHSVGFVFQSYNLIPHQTVLQNVELALTLSGVSKSERRRRAKEALEQVGLGNQLRKRPSEMSGGQMQRVAIARAIVNDPDIVLADEPTGALDTETSIQVMEILKEISQDRLVIMVTHNPDLAQQAEDSPAVQAQLENPSTDIFTGLPFQETTGDLTDEEKQEAFLDYVSALDQQGKAETYLAVMSIPTQEQVDQALEQSVGSMTREEKEDTLRNAMTEQAGIDEAKAQEYLASMSGEELEELFAQMAEQQYRAQYAAGIQQQLSSQDPAALAAALDQAVGTYTTQQCALYYDQALTFSDSTLEENLTELGYVDLEDPDSINLYASSFENKDVIEQAIADYNADRDDLEQIQYTDYIGLILSSVTSIINAITYVLIAFVAVSLIVSSIMIGVITLISVQERTKEIGILRAIGASKSNVSRMFNAETLIIGFTSGALGVLITYLLCIPINMILHHFTGIQTLNATLPPLVALILVLISMGLTLFSGIIPSRSAAKKDPVVALRTE